MVIGRRRQLHRRTGRCGEDARRAAPASSCTSRTTRANSSRIGKIESVVRTYSDHIAHPIMLARRHQDTAGRSTPPCAIWMRPKPEITPEQYKEFFGHVTGSYSTSRR